jgi:putative DNA-invertase from lambdoid prophage Rac
MMTKCAVYARVSTDDQTEENQIDPMLALARQRGYEVFEVYREQASAWKNGHQKELSRLFEDARKGKFQVVIVWALDRLTREGVMTMLQYYKRFTDYGVSCISLKEPWTEMPSEVKPLLLSVIGWVAEQESKRRSERVKAGMERIAATGKHMGRPRKSKDSIPEVKNVKA